MYNSSSIVSFINLLPKVRNLISQIGDDSFSSREYSDIRGLGANFPSLQTLVKRGLVKIVKQVPVKERTVCEKIVQTLEGERICSEKEWNLMSKEVRIRFGAVRRNVSVTYSLPVGLKNIYALDFKNIEQWNNKYITDAYDFLERKTKEAEAILRRVERGKNQLQ